MQLKLSFSVLESRFGEFGKLAIVLYELKGLDGVVPGGCLWEGSVETPEIQDLGGGWAERAEVSLSSLDPVHF